MGYTTDIIGTVEVTPKLSDAEMSYLTAFAATRRWFRQEGPYVVLDNPSVDEPYDDVELYNRPWLGEPSLWCHWVPCWEGCCLSFDGGEKFYAPTQWLRYLIEHFLAPDARAAKSGNPAFTEFSFDHELNGVLAARRRDTGRLWLIKVRANRVREQTLVHGVSEEEIWGALPYETAADEFKPRRRRRRSGGQAKVVTLTPASRRRGTGSTSA